MISARQLSLRGDFCGLSRSTPQSVSCIHAADLWVGTYKRISLLLPKDLLWSPLMPARTPWGQNPFINDLSQLSLAVSTWLLRKHICLFYQTLEMCIIHILSLFSGKNHTLVFMLPVFQGTYAKFSKGLLHCMSSWSFGNVLVCSGCSDKTLWTRWLINNNMVI